MATDSVAVGTGRAPAGDGPTPCVPAGCGGVPEGVGCDSEVSVGTGQVGCCRGRGVLRASAIASCVAVAVYDPVCRAGGMAHVMLPGARPRGRSLSEGMRHAEEAIPELLRRMSAVGSVRDRLVVCVVGGGDVLGHGPASPGPSVVRSVLAVLRKEGLTPVASDLGGTERRSCVLDVARGRVAHTVGDSGARVLWEAPCAGKTVGRRGS